MYMLFKEGEGMKGKAHLFSECQLKKILNSMTNFFQFLENYSEISLLYNQNFF